MEFLSSIEGRIDKWFGRIFANRRGRTGVQPVMIAKESVKAMEGMRQVSVDTVYVPNHFDVRLHPHDHAMIAPVRFTVKRDCAAYIVRTAKRRGFSFAGSVEVEFTTDESVSPGELSVIASYREQGPVPALDADTARFLVDPPGSPPERHTSDETGTRLYGGVSAGPAQEGVALLEVLSGGEEIRLPLVPGETYTVGRAADNHLQLDDARVSRRHARLIYEDGSWWIEDLQTTNGTRKNGAEIRRSRLQDGDELTMGLTVMRYMERTHIR